MVASPSGRLRKQMGTTRRWLTERLQNAKNILAKSTPDQRIAQLNLRDELRAGRGWLAKSVSLLQAHDREFHELIQRSADDTERATEEQYYDDTAEDANDGYLALLSEGEMLLDVMDARIQRLDEVDPTPQVVAVSGSSQQAGASAIPVPASGSASHFSVIKPPKISLPSFDGDIQKWFQFWTIFKANIHDRPGLTKVEKLTYLIPQLKGAALDAVEGLPPTDQGYDVAISILQERFDKAKERLGSLLFSQLKQIQRCGNKLDEKRRTYDACEKIFRQMEENGTDLNDTLLLNVEYLSKFPKGLVQHLQQQYKVGPNSPLPELRNAVKTSVAEMEAMAGFFEDLDIVSGHASQDHGKKSQSSNLQKSSPRKPQWWTNRRQGYQGEEPSGSSTFSTMAIHDNVMPQVSQTPPRGCYFCDGAHFLGQCTTFDTVAKRRKRLTEVKRCSRCTQRHPVGMPRDQNCRRPLRCYHCQAENDHHSSLCATRFPSGVPLPRGSYGGKPPKKGGSNLSALNHAQNRNTFFQTAKVTAVDLQTGREARLRIALDTMSNRTYITNAAADRLKLDQDGSNKLFISVFGASKQIDIPTTQVRFGIRERNGNVRTIEANTITRITNSSVLPQVISDTEAELLRPYHSSGNLADDPWDEENGVDILIGSAYTWEIIAGGKLQLADRLYLIPTTVGMMLAGESDCPDSQDDNSRTFLCLTEQSGTAPFPSELGVIAATSKAPTDYPDISEFWELETIGIKDSPTIDDDETALDIYKKAVFKQDGRYQVVWPWIEEHKALLPTNYDVSLKRFRSLSQRLRTDTRLLESYRDTMKTQAELGIIERVPENEVETSNAVHYLPHHPIVKESSATTKVRIVFDASSKSKKDEKSLNECLLRGPVLLPDLCHLLMRFRIRKIAIIADIEKAFLQVSLQTSERNVTRFFWFDDDQNPNVNNNLAIYRFCRVLFGVISSPFLLMITIIIHLQSIGSPLALQLIEEFFVDNVLSGADTDQDAIEYYEQVKAIFKDASMNLREFCSNSEKFMKAVPEADRVANQDVKVLGLKWDSGKDDSLRIRESREIVNPKSTNTKRSILAALASVFDPLGLFQPSLLPAKLLLQKVWEHQLPWDEPIKDESLNHEWNQIREDVATIFEHRMPRYIGEVNESSVLLIFSDASMKAYGAAAYLRCAKYEKVETSLLFAKSRLAPSRGIAKQSHRITLPRLELMGATIAARMAKFCRKGIRSPCKVYFFIDSECVLHWIRSQTQLKRFVANRVTEIRTVENCEFRYVKTDENPADLISRGKSAAELIGCHLWWHGPDWAVRPEPEWPVKGPEIISDEDLRLMEAEIKAPTVVQTLVAQADTEISSDFLGIDVKNFSSLRKLLRTTCVVLKFVKGFIWLRLSDDTRKQFESVGKVLSSVKSTVEIEPEDLEAALRLWIKNVQEKSFGEVFAAVQSKKRNNLIEQLGIRIDQDGLLRAHSRFKYADLPQDAQSPWVLPKNHPFSWLAVQDAHRKALHAGVSHTLCETRQRFWITHGRAFVRKVLRRCVICQKHKTASPFARPEMPDWPRERTKRFHPFQNTGLDYLGPIPVKIGGEKRKIWVCLFTCIVTRAIHLEAVTDCTSTEFLQCLTRFISRRGCPEQIISDNASQFVLVKILADKAWKLLSDKTVKTFMVNRKIRWKFITQLAPWQGGFYERLVGVVKSVLRKSIGRRLLTWTELVTLLTEVEAVVNSRPLTYISDDIESQPRILRPVDFMSQLPVMLPDIDQAVSRNQFGEAGKKLLTLWKERSKQLDRVWKVWYEDYLLNMRESGRRFHKRGRSDKDLVPQIGQVVLLKDEDVPRGAWKLCRISKVIQSQDGKVRSVEVKLPNGMTLRRPINHLLPLELGQDSERSEHAEEGGTGDEDDGPDDQDEKDEDQDEKDEDQDEDVEKDDAQDEVQDDGREEDDSDQDNQDESTGIPWDADFLGFSQDDVARTTRLLQGFRDGDGVSDRDRRHSNASAALSGRSA